MLANPSFTAAGCLKASRLVSPPWNMPMTPAKGVQRVLTATAVKLQTSSHTEVLTGLLARCRLVQECAKLPCQSAVNAPEEGFPACLKGPCTCKQSSNHHCHHQSRSDTHWLQWRPAHASPSDSSTSCRPSQGAASPPQYQLCIPSPTSIYEAVITCSQTRTATPATIEVVCRGVPKLARPVDMLG